MEIFDPKYLSFMDEQLNDTGTSNEKFIFYSFRSDDHSCSGADTVRMTSRGMVTMIRFLNQFLSKKKHHFFNSGMMFMSTKTLSTYHP